MQVLLHACWVVAHHILLHSSGFGLNISQCQTISLHVQIIYFPTFFYNLTICNGKVSSVVVMLLPPHICICYSIVKDSSADLGVNFKIVQNRPTVKAVCTKISKNFFCIFVNIFIFLRENKEVSFFIFWIFKLKQP